MENYFWTVGVSCWEEDRAPRFEAEAKAVLSFKRTSNAFPQNCEIMVKQVYVLLDINVLRFLDNVLASVRYVLSYIKNFKNKY